MTALSNPYSGMSYAELCGRRKDFAKLQHAAVAARKAAERHLTLIRQAMESLETGGDVIEVSDHAVIRYLERVHGADVAAIRDTISAKCAAGDNIRGADGHIYVVNNEGHVTTILPLGAVLEELHRDLTKPAINGHRKRVQREKRELLRETYRDSRSKPEGRRPNEDSGSVHESGGAGTAIAQKRCP
jgi:hypothetical protein